MRMAKSSSAGIRLCNVSKHRFCERQFDEKMVLTAHQKAKHFTCPLCAKKLNSVVGMFQCISADAAGLQNHLKTVHRQALDKVANALEHRSNPATIPDISGMDGIPAKDLQDFKARMLPSQTASQKQQKPWKPSDPSKRIKIDTPLATETIQAQLAEFQKKKDDQQIQQLINEGISFPPGLSPRQALHIFAFRHPPPGTGPYAAKSKLQLYPMATSLTDGKSDAITPQSNSFRFPACPPKFAPKSTYL